MSVRKLDENLDWTFGQGRANYITGALEVRQNVLTRLRSFKNDWLWDIDANIDWINLLANRNNQQIILREIERVTFQTPGVREVLNVSIVQINDRSATINLSFNTIYDEKFIEQIGINL